MYFNTVISSSNRRIIISDILVLALIYSVPAIAHLVPFQLYLLDPMRILLLTGYLLSRNLKNAFFLAVTIPIFSMLLSGHPHFFKAFLISIELMVNVGIFIFLSKKLRGFMPIILFLSILSSKLVYYTLKYLFLSFSIMDGELISTSLMVQLINVVSISIIFPFFIRKETKF